MQLFSRTYPAADSASPQALPLCILHGLYGNQGNWMPQAKVLSKQRTVHVLDLRNHGRSPHLDTMTYLEMAVDVAETLRELRVSRCSMLGHSMGGKVAMMLALMGHHGFQSAKLPSTGLGLARLIVADISPVDYVTGNRPVIEALEKLNLNNLTSRRQADEQLSQSISNPRVREFLLTNLQRTDHGFSWRFNLPIVSKAFRNIVSWPSEIVEGRSYQGPVLFIRGENSDYILPAHQGSILALFPNATLKSIHGAGHWVHSEKPEAFVRLLQNFLQED
jgi:esterase